MNGELDLDRTSMVQAGEDVHVFLWKGMAPSSTFAIALAANGLECAVHDLGVLTARTTQERVEVALRTIVEGPPITVVASGDFDENLREAKYDDHVPEATLGASWVDRHQALERRLRTMAEWIIG